MGNPQPQHFGMILRERRLARGYSLRKFAELVEVSPTYLSLVETGKAEYAPAADRVKRMAELLDADADEWITKAGRMPEDLKEIILSDLEQMPALLRAAKGLTPEQLRQFIEDMQRGKGEGDERS